MNHKFLIFTFFVISLLPQILTIKSKENEIPKLHGGFLPKASVIEAPRALNPKNNVEVISPPPEEQLTIIQSTAIEIKKVKENDSKTKSRQGHQTIIQQSSNAGNNNTIIQGIVNDGMRAGVDETIIQGAANYGDDNIGDKVDQSKRSKDKIPQVK